MDIDVTIKQIQLQVQEYTQQAVACEWPFAEMPEMSVFRYRDMSQVILRGIQRVAVQEECVATYPANWKEAVKQRFAPRWFLKRWPVVETRIDMRVLYPKIALPRNSPVVTIAVMEEGQPLRRFGK